MITDPWKRVDNLVALAEAVQRLLDDDSALLTSAERDEFETALAKVNSLLEVIHLDTLYQH